jgi:chemotaxis protein MotB
MRHTLVLAVLAALAGGCVSSGKFEQKQHEADGYAKELATQRDEGQRLAAELEKSRTDLLAAQKESEGLRVGRDQAERSLAAEREKLATTKRADLDRQQKEFEDARKSLQEQISKGDVELKRFRDRVIFGMSERVLFPSGSATLGRSGNEALKKVASAIQDMLGKAEAEGRHRLVRVEGHTDNVPIATERFPSNWELSSARATAVVRFLEGAGLPREKIWAAGFGEMWPVATNTTSEGRARNRRIEVVLVPDAEKPAVQAETSAPTAGGR